MRLLCTEEPQWFRRAAEKSSFSYIGRTLEVAVVALLARVASEAAEDGAHHSVLTEAETSGLYVLTSFFLRTIRIA